jgi:hypothetical protein
MARKPSVWFREQDGWYYTTVAGKQIKLSQVKDEAETEFHSLLSRHKTKAEPNLSRPSLRRLCDDFLEWTQKNTTPDTFVEKRRTFLLGPDTPTVSHLID